MKSSKAQTRSQSREIQAITFDEQPLTAYAGLVLFHRLFRIIDLKRHLASCFSHLKSKSIFGYARIFLLLIVHLLLGFRELRQLRYYAEDPMVARVLGLKRLPDVATVSRHLSGADQRSVDNLSELNSDQLCQALARQGLRRVTLDFDGSVLGTGRHAEGTAIGFNRQKKGQRSYYPLNCTIAETGQVLAFLMRSGNVHDANGAQDFISACVDQVRHYLPTAAIDVRLDGAFFADELVTSLEALQVGYTISVPFERFVELKAMIEQQTHWWPINQTQAGFEAQWAPKCWAQARRFVFVRQTVQTPIKEPLQLDLFQPRETHFSFKVILTNKTAELATIVPFHDGRGAQEGLFAELKSDNGLAYIPTQTWVGNQLFMLAAVFAHNLTRELQMRTRKPTRHNHPKRTALWPFQRLDTLRQNLLHRAGRIIRPQGRLTLSMNANEAVQRELLHCLNHLEESA